MVEGGWSLKDLCIICKAFITYLMVEGGWSLRDLVSQDAVLHRPWEEGESSLSLSESSCYGDLQKLQ